MSHRDYECEVCGTDVCEQEPSAAEEAAHLAACEAAMLGNGEVSATPEQFLAENAAILRAVAR